MTRSLIFDYYKQIASYIFKPQCAASSLAASLGNPGAATFRLSCGITEIITIGVAGVAVFLILLAFKLPKWARFIPLWIASAYGLVFVPATIVFENSSEMAFMGQKTLSKTEWINLIANDSRTRLSLCVSLISAFIVSLAAWLNRWDAKSREAQP